MTNKPRFQREFDRLFAQFRNVNWALAGTLRRNRYDRRRKDQLRVTEGAVPASGDIAIMLIYQPNSVLESTFFALSWLFRQGVAPVVVSNLPLSDADRARLAGLSHLVIERPNIGYDFGGYREGIMTILERGLEPDALYVMNDSMWFPLHEGSDTIRLMRQSPADLYGLFYNRVMRKGGQSYLQSYCFRFGKRLVTSDDFRDYWRRMRLLDDKYMVVRRYERRMTKHFTDQGYTLAYRNRRQDLIDALIALDDESLQAAVTYMIEADPKDATRLQPLVTSGRDFADIRPEIEDLIRLGKVQNTFTYAPPELLLRMGVPFLKKANSRQLRLQRRRLVDCDLMVDFAAPIRDEITRWDSVQATVAGNSESQEN